MKNPYFAILLFAGQMIWAQVGINTTAPNAQLEIKSSNQAAPANTDGILIPKIDAFPAINPTAAQQGMMVFLTTVSGGNSPGFYYWNNPTLSWMGISASSGNWLLKGNTGTSPLTQFLGTTDNVDLGIRTNNVEVIRVKNDGRVEIGNNGTNPTYLGQTSTSKKLFVASSTVSNNVIFQSSTTSADPMSIYIGNSRGSVATPLISQNGDQISNIFFSGYDGTKFLNAAGITCSIDGTVSADNMSGSLLFSTNQAGQFPSTRMMIRANGNIGIGTSNPLDKLHIVGNIRMVDGNQATGKVLTSDANGTASWQNPLTIAQTWGLTGNSGTSSSTNFLGTTDDVDLVFKRFNTRAGLIGSTNTSLGLAALNPASTGTNNTAIGSGSLDTNTTGFDNVAVGYNALTTNTGGDHNTAIGVASLVTNSNGDHNTAVGRSALFDNTASNNTAVGYNALNNVTTGTNNTAVGASAFTGFNSGSNNTSIGAETSSLSTLYDNATAIGYKATVGNSNVMVLGSINGINGATASVNVGIGTTSPQTALEIVDASVTTSSTVEGNLNVVSNDPQAIDLGGSISLGGTNNDAGTAYRTFGTIEGRKANGTTGNSLGYLIFKTNSGVLGERMRITSSGDVGIGTAAPGGQFELSLNEGRKPGTNTWTVTSDARLKTVTGDFTKGLNEIRQLKPIRYHYKNIGNRIFEPEVLKTEFSGFLAQDVQKVFPNCVTTDADGYLSLDIHEILIASVNAVKELDVKNSELKSENEQLKLKLKQHDEQIAAILAELERRK
ncbi:tail fiber domain-containing protein [Flavobacterium sp.]